MKSCDANSPKSLAANVNTLADSRKRFLPDPIKYHSLLIDGWINSGVVEIVLVHGAAVMLSSVGEMAPYLCHPVP